MEDEPDAVPNDAFFVAPEPLVWPPRRHRQRSIPDIEFYGRAAPPADEVPFTIRFAERPLVFATSIFVVGWLGILAQKLSTLASIRQIVVGAPVFEELAKLGLALLAIALARVRQPAMRLPFGWASGALFGVLEHFLSYSSESPSGFVDRVTFHAAACGLSVTVYSMLEPLPDVRARWFSTIASSLAHFANNFGVVLLAIFSAIAGFGDAIVLGWSILVTSAALVVTFAVLASMDRLRPRAQRELATLLAPLHPRGGPTGATPEVPVEWAAGPWPPR